MIELFTTRWIALYRSGWSFAFMLTVSMTVVISILMSLSAGLDIRRERKERHEHALMWLAALTGIIGALTGLVAVLL